MLLTFRDVRLLCALVLHSRLVIDYGDRRASDLSGSL